MSEKDASNQRLPLARIIVGAAILIFVASLLLPQPRGEDAIKKARSEVRLLHQALKEYRAQYGASVTGEQSRAVATLVGNNPKKIVFFQPIRPSYNARGQLVDPWDSPYVLDQSDETGLRVWSCGKNRRDDGGAEGSDDIPSWR